MELVQVPPRPSKLAVSLLLTGLVVWAGVGLEQCATHSEPSYFMVSDLFAADLRQQAGELRVHGWVLAGSITVRLDGKYTFVLHHHGKKLRVVLGTFSEQLRDQAELVVRGRLATSSEGWSLEGNEVLARCGPGKWDGDPKPDDSQFK